ncbi:MAG: SagB family peptide dehydrogenase [Gemmatimonadaceae bacterium]|nr:SagB family peptide dehydrogenase [Gemmatimonadaceae bacterium]
MSSATRHLGLLPLVQRSRARPRAARLHTADDSFEVTCRTRGAWLAFCRLTRRVVSEDGLRAVAAADSPAALREWERLLGQLHARGALRERWLIDDHWLADVEPICPAGPHAGRDRRAPRRRRGTRGAFVLSRFAYLSRDGDQPTLASPISTVRLVCSPVMVRAIGLLASTQTAATLRAALDVPASTAAQIVRLLRDSAMLTSARADGGTAEDTDPVLQQWEFADLLLQHRHRGGRHDGVVGATFQYEGIRPPEPALDRWPVRRRLALPRPATDLDVVGPQNPPLGAVIEARESVRQYGTRPITIDQLGALLWRSARVRAEYPMGPGRRYAITDRPYPSGGGCYPLDIIVVVGRCRGVPRGIHHYDPVAHRLGWLGRHGSTAEWLLEDARNAQGQRGGAQVLLVFVARFRRLTWKYRSIALATILKDVGALLQTFYLNATALGLAPCGVGSGDSTRLGRVIGRRFEEASSVGEMLIGSRPE